MATLLLIVIYIAFIGLGVPDSLFGTAWPAIYTDLNLPVSWASMSEICLAVQSPSRQRTPITFNSESNSLIAMLSSPFTRLQSFLYLYTTTVVSKSQYTTVVV